MARLFLRGRIFHTKYYVNGIPHQASLKTDNRRIAERRVVALLKKSARGWEPQDDRLMFDGLIEKVRLDREVRKRRCNDLDQRAVHLRLFMGDMRAVDITTETVEQYVTSRLMGQAAHATINRELALLRRGFMLAELLSHGPRIQLLPENNARQDFLDWADFQAVRANLPEWMQDFTTAAFFTAWRQGQLAALEWRDVDMKARTMTARQETTKSALPHRVPLVGEVWEIIERRHGNRQLDCPFVFNRAGEQILLRGSTSPLRRAWGKACRKAGFPNHTLHCLRRSGIRFMVQTGNIDTYTAMAFSGHKTRSVFDRYNIQTVDGMRRAMETSLVKLAEQPSEGKVRKIG